MTRKAVVVQAYEQELQALVMAERALRGLYTSQQKRVLVYLCQRFPEAAVQAGLLRNYEHIGYTPAALVKS